MHRVTGNKADGDTFSGTGNPLKELMQQQHIVNSARKWAITPGFAYRRFSAELTFPILVLPKIINFH